MDLKSRQHPKAAEIGWKLLASHDRFENKMMRVREDRLALAQDGDNDFAYVERGPAVIIVPVTRRGEIVLIRQYRYAVDEFCLEVPAGTARDAGNRSLEEVAAKELCEEVGATYERITRVTSFFSNSSLSDEECHVFLALGVELVHAPEPEPSEKIQIIVKPAKEVLEIARSGAMKTAPTTLAVFLAEPMLRQLGIV
jgi:ADP-ribose pyrophosphatase